MFSFVKALILTFIIAFFVLYSMPDENKVVSDSYARDLSSSVFDYKMKNIYYHELLKKLFLTLTALFQRTTL